MKISRYFLFLSLVVSCFLIFYRSQSTSKCNRFKRLKSAIRSAIVTSAILSGLISGSGSANAIGFENSKNPVICRVVLNNETLNSFIEFLKDPVRNLEFLFNFDTAPVEAKNLYEEIKSDEIAFKEVIDIVDKLGDGRVKILGDGRLKVGDKAVQKMIRRIRYTKTKNSIPIYRVKTKHVRVYFRIKENKVQLLLTGLETKKNECLRVLTKYSL